MRSRFRVRFDAMPTPAHMKTYLDNSNVNPKEVSIFKQYNWNNLEEFYLNKISLPKHISQDLFEDYYHCISKITDEDRKDAIKYSELVFKEDPSIGLATYDIKNNYWTFRLFNTNISLLKKNTETLIGDHLEINIPQKVHKAKYLEDGMVSIFEVLHNSQVDLGIILPNRKAVNKNMHENKIIQLWASCICIPISIAILLLVLIHDLNPQNYSIKLTNVLNRLSLFIGPLLITGLLSLIEYWTRKIKIKKLSVLWGQTYKNNDVEDN